MKVKNWACGRALDFIPIEGIAIQGIGRGRDKLRRRLQGDIPRGSFSSLLTHGYAQGELAKEFRGAP
jgi:hypothetical protein